MLIRNAVIDGYPGPVDLRLMHGKVQEIGVGLQKGLYESEIDVEGDEVRPLTADVPLPQRLRRRTATYLPGTRIAAGQTGPLVRWRGETVIAVLDQHAAD